VRYGLQFQLIVPSLDGHISVGVHLDGDPVRIAHLVAAALSSCGGRDLLAARSDGPTVDSSTNVNAPTMSQTARTTTG
jgi:hypothetical protein